MNLFEIIQFIGITEILFVLLLCSLGNPHRKRDSGRLPPVGLHDRGHLAPAADMAFSGQTMADSFFMSNMSPQKPAFNRGIWKNLEALVRYFAITERKIVVVTGPILPKEKTITIGTNQVTVPTHYYKVIFDLTPPQKMIGFILPNEGCDEPLATFSVTVDAVEKATGLNFFSRVPKEEQERLESTISTKAW